MSHLALVRPLYAHMEWADAVVWRTVLATAGAADDKTLREKLYHIHMVQKAFLVVWRGEPMAFEKLASFETLGSLASWGRGHHADLAKHLDGVDEAATDAPLKMPWADRLVAPLGLTSAAQTTVGETMLQVPLHSTYHRGQVNMRLRELGGEPPLVDYIAWLWLGKPRPEWPEEVGS